VLRYFRGGKQRLAYTGATHPSTPFQVMFATVTRARAHTHTHVAKEIKKQLTLFQRSSTVTIGHSPKHDNCCRTAAFDNMGILETSQVEPVITMVMKKGRRAIENAETIMNHLRAKYTSARFEMLEGEAIAMMSVKQQVSNNFQCIHASFLMM